MPFEYYKSLTFDPSIFWWLLVPAALLIVGTVIAAKKEDSPAAYLGVFLMVMSIVGSIFLYLIPVFSYEAEKSIHKTEWSSETAESISEYYGLPLDSVERALPDLARAYPKLEYVSDVFPMKIDGEFTQAIIEISEDGELSLFQGKDEMVELEPVSE